MVSTVCSLYFNYIYIYIYRYTHTYLKQGAALSPYLYNFALEYVIRTVQANQGRLKLNGTHQLPVCTDSVTILGESIRTMKKNTEVLVVASREIGPEVNAEKTKLMVMMCKKCRMKSQHKDR
jgi:hypothetical protein